MKTRAWRRPDADSGFFTCGPGIPVVLSLTLVLVMAACDDRGTGNLSGEIAVPDCEAAGTIYKRSLSMDLGFFDMRPTGVTVTIRMQRYPGRATAEKGRTVDGLTLELSRADLIRAGEPVKVAPHTPDAPWTGFKERPAARVVLRLFRSCPTNPLPFSDARGAVVFSSFGLKDGSRISGTMRLEFATSPRPQVEGGKGTLRGDFDFVYQPDADLEKDVVGPEGPPRSAIIFCHGRRMHPICKEERSSQAAGVVTWVKGLAASTDDADWVPAADQGST